MGVKLAAASGGSIELVPTNTASAFTVTVPAVTATVLTDSTGILNIGSGQIYKDASGNMVIGTSSLNGTYAPRLQVESGASDGTGGLLIGSYLPTLTLFDYSGGAGASQLQQDGTNFLIKNGGSVRAIIDSSGNVGIGTSSPTSISGYTALKINNATNGAIIDLAQADTMRGRLVATSGSFSLETSGSIPLIFAPAGTERARIDSSGNLLVGTTSNGLNVRLNVIAQNVENPAAIGAQVGTNGAYALGVQNVSGTNVGGVIANASTTSYATSSDYRLKENIAPMMGALDKVAQLKPCTYNWKVDGSEGQGFIAHELQAVVPDCVTGEKDATEIYTDEDGNEQTRPKSQGIDTSFLVATLTAAIQEQQALIVQLQADVAALKGAQP